ncbi:sugar ABC transporter substrate-binding protein [Pseudoclavibacter chungangensis]|uniref:Sugar ABC transporter substrate-binding protein n=1 Tax=Pseudoclavibacter chungangensis TaxID=587635 RepID=A0A7J5BWZ7_9MICO|nr:sugar ABC transporter substrate-binding protein [Pseudoclavibacter chungangensis]KAB1658020.1 sugar ABC transporter substrate-binding protein [Pseudoclavibacter chungangensis]NYJ65815.1 ribose transport system substrate-binding protein [Pseudoclavibacter chungangensis]
MRNSFRVAAVAAGLVTVLLGATACADAVSSGGGSGEAGQCAPEDVQLVQSGRGLDNEYYVAVDAAARAFAASQGLEDNYHWIASDGDSSKQLRQIKSILAKGGECVVLNVDANESSLVPSIVKEAENAGAWLVTQWNRPDGVAPETSDSPNWVAHMSVDGVPQGYETAKALFERMGGSGSIVALQGILDNPPAKERFEGLQQALEEYPGITLLEDQTAEWSRTSAQDITQTFLTKYPGQIGGVWAANDSMALGALEAIKNAGQQGTIAVSGIDGLSEAIDLVQDPASGYVATSQSTAAAQAAFGLAIGLAAATGQIDPSSEPAEHRSFYLKPLPAVTPDTASSLPDPADISGFDLTDIWSEVGGPIT